MLIIDHSIVFTIYIIINNSEKEDLVTEMLKIAKEEIEHFQLVHEIIKQRGLELCRERKDDYVGKLYEFMKKGGNRTEVLVDRLLFAAMIEARSCERFKVLSENIKDKELSDFYHELMISEAGHYTLFLKLAKQYAAGLDVDKRWQEFLDFEGTVIAKYGNKETVHG